MDGRADRGRHQCEQQLVRPRAGAGIARVQQHQPNRHASDPDDQLAAASLQREPQDRQQQKQLVADAIALRSVPHQHHGGQRGGRRQQANLLGELVSAGHDHGNGSGHQQHGEREDGPRRQPRVVDESSQDRTGAGRGRDDGESVRRALASLCVGRQPHSAGDRPAEPCS